MVTPPKDIFISLRFSSQNPTALHRKSRSKVPKQKCQIVPAGLGSYPAISLIFLKWKIQSIAETTKDLQSLSLSTGKAGQTKSNKPSKTVDVFELAFDDSFDRAFHVYVSSKIFTASENFSTRRGRATGKVPWTSSQPPSPQTLPLTSCGAKSRSS